MTTRFNADIVSRLGEATPEEIRAALTAIREDAAEINGAGAMTTERVEALTALAGHAQALNAELESRGNLAAQGSDVFASIQSLTEQPAADPETPPADPAAPPADPETPPVEDPPADPENPPADPPTDPQNPEETVTASGRRPLGNVTPPPSGDAPPPLVARTRTVAHSNVRGAAAGSQLTREQMLTAFGDMVRVTSSNRAPGGERHPIMTRLTEYPEARTLTASAAVNAERLRGIGNVIELDSRARREDPNPTRQSLTAAGFCAPFETLYDIPVVGSVDRPVRDALVRVGADRGGIVYRPVVSGVGQTGGIGFWTEANDEANPRVPKNCVEITCPGVITAQVEAIYQCLTFPNMSVQFDPEWYASVVDAQDVAYARIAENRALTTMTTASKTIYSTRLLGAVRDTLATLDKMIAYKRSVERLSDEVPLRWIAPLWGLYQMRADMTRQMVGDGMQALAVTDQAITAWFTARNVNPTWHLDGIDPADITIPDPDIVVPAQFYTSLAAGSPVPSFPNPMSTLLFRDGDWMFLDGGQLDMGVVRDSTLNADNRFQLFSEGFEFPAFRGVESIHLVLDVRPTGQSAATVSTASAA